MAINRRSLLKGFAVAAVGAAAGFSSTVANAAGGKVMYKDIRRETPEVVELSGPVASGNNKIALKVNGGDKAFFRSTAEAAKNIAQKSGRDVWVLLSKDDDPNDGKIKIDVYVSGGKTGTLTTFNTDLLNEQLIAAVNNGIRRSTASLDQPAEVK